MFRVVCGDFFSGDGCSVREVFVCGSCVWFDCSLYSNIAVFSERGGGRDCWGRKVQGIAVEIDFGVYNSFDYNCVQPQVLFDVFVRVE